MLQTQLFIYAQLSPSKKNLCQIVWVLLGFINESIN